MIETKFDIGDEVWFLQKESSNDYYGHIGRGKICKIYVEHGENYHSEHYDIDGMYDTGFMSGVCHFNISDWYIRKTKEEMEAVDWWH